MSTRVFKDTVIGIIALGVISSLIATFIWGKFSEHQSTEQQNQSAPANGNGSSNSPTTSSEMSQHEDGALRFLRSAQGHRGSVEELEFSPDGKTLASGGDDGAVRLWNVDSGQSIGGLVGHKSSITSIAYSADGHLLASGSKDATVRVWDVRTHGASRIFRLADNSEYVRPKVAFSPDGTLLAALNDDVITVWNIASGEATANISPEGLSLVGDLAFSLDGNYLLVGNYANAYKDSAVIAIELRSGLVVRKVIQGFDFGVFSPDQQTVAVEGHYSPDGNSILLYDASSGVHLRTLGVGSARCLVPAFDGLDRE
jgi:WD40 repeat protein